MAGAIPIALIFLAGCSIGILFYGGLWLTVRALPKVRHPALLAFASFWGRTALVIVAFVLLSDASWQNALACLLGFVVARLAFVPWIPRYAAKKGLV